MPEEIALRFTDEEQIGTVAGVDTSRVFIEVSNHALVTRMSVASLVAIEGAVANEFLVGIADRITRSVESEPLIKQEDSQGQIPFGEVERDAVYAVLLGTFRARFGEKRNVFKRGADSFPQIERKCFIIEADNLQRLMTLFSADLGEKQRLRLGHYVADRTAVAIADGNKLFQRHAAVIGSTGSGKSWSVALMLERASALDHPNLIVLDMHGEYSPLGGDKGYGRLFRIAGPGDLESTDEGVIFLPYWLLNREEMLAMLLDRSDQNAPNQATRFTNHARALKEKTLKTLDKPDVLSTFTVDSPIPYDIGELIALLIEDDTGRVEGAKAGTDKLGPFNGKLTRFISRLETKIDDRRYGFLFRPPQKAHEYEWLTKFAECMLASGGKHPGIKIIDFSEVPSDVLPIVVGVFARVLYSVQFWMAEAKRTPVTFVCDEAHLYLPVQGEADSAASRALDSFERIAKEGRKYGVSLLVITQRPSDINRTILSQCNNFIALRLTNDQDQSAVKRLMPESMGGITEILPLLDIGEALLLGDSVILPTRVRLDEPKLKPRSATREFWSEWQAREPDIDAIGTAVESLRRQTRV